jgi:opacity protein-like surface antigen
MRKLLFVASLLILLPLAAFAQDKPKVEVFGGYSYLRTDDDFLLDNLNLHGWNAAVTGNINKWFGITGDFSGHYNDYQISPGVRADISGHIFLTGPQLAYRKNDVWQPFVHVLVGAARQHISVPTATGRVKNTDTAFAMALGGGLDAHIAKHLAVRLFQTDYVLTTFDDGDNNAQNNFRLSTGLVLRLGDH